MPCRLQFVLALTSNTPQPILELTIRNKISGTLSDNRKTSLQNPALEFVSLPNFLLASLLPGLVLARTFAMLTLLDLPQPVRARIFGTCLQTELEPPQTLEELYTRDATSKIQRIHRHGNDVAEVAIERCIRYPFTIALPFSGLLRASSGIRQDVKAVMQTLKTKRIAYKLDLAVENEVSILPSWIRCPVKSMEVARLDIDVRLLGSIEDAGSQADLAGLLQHGRDRCRTLAFAIVALIARFIERGPRFEHSRQGEIKVQTIMLNFYSPKEETSSVPERKRLGRSDSVQEEHGLMEHLELSSLHSEDEHGSVHDSVMEDQYFGNKLASHSHDSSESVGSRELLRTVDLVLRPLCRHEKYTLERRQRHFSNAHLGILRRNVRKIYLTLDGMPEKAMMVES